MKLIARGESECIHLSEDGSKPACKQNGLYSSYDWEVFTASSTAKLCQNCKGKVYKRVRREAQVR